MTPRDEWYFRPDVSRKKFQVFSLKREGGAGGGGGLWAVPHASCVIFPS